MLCCMWKNLNHQVQMGIICTVESAMKRSMRVVRAWKLLVLVLVLLSLHTEIAYRSGVMKRETRLVKYVFRLEGKVAIITGAASGIGEATAILFAEHGAFVVIADIQDELGEQVVASIGLEKASYKHCDVRDEKQVEETVGYAIQKYGTLDIMYSNAGIMGELLQSNILEMDMDHFDKTMSINLRGSALAIKYAARAMVAKQIRGSIICTASMASSLGGCGPIAYTASKHGLLGIIKSATSDLGKYGIRVNSISPFGVATPMACGTRGQDPSSVEAVVSKMANLKGIVLKAKHIADAALFLASDESAYVSGHNLAVDGGASVVSNIMGVFVPA